MKDFCLKWHFRFHVLRISELTLPPGALAPTLSVLLWDLPAWPTGSDKMRMIIYLLPNPHQSSVAHALTTSRLRAQSPCKDGRGEAPAERPHPPRNADSILRGGLPAAIRASPGPPERDLPLAELASGLCLQSLCPLPPLWGSHGLRTRVGETWNSLRQYLENRTLKPMNIPARDMSDSAWFKAQGRVAQSVGAQDCGHVDLTCGAHPWGSQLHLLVVLLLVRTSSQHWLHFAISCGAFKKILMCRPHLRRTKLEYLGFQEQFPYTVSTKPWTTICFQWQMNLRKPHKVSEESQRSRKTPVCNTVTLNIYNTPQKVLFLWRCCLFTPMISMLLCNNPSLALIIWHAWGTSALSSLQKHWLQIGLDIQLLLLFLPTHLIWSQHLVGAQYFFFFL